METNEILTNEEVIEKTEDVVKNVHASGTKLMAGFGLGIMAGILGYRYIYRPIKNKLKTRWEEHKAEQNIIDLDDYKMENADSEEIE